MTKWPIHDLLASLPPISGDRRGGVRIRELLAGSKRKVVVLDDDPTGTQTVHGVPVLTAWSEEMLAEALREPGSCFFVLTNTRAMTPSDAAALNRELAANLCLAAQRTGMDFAVVSRSDSTLRGHYPVETDALAEGLGQVVDATLLVPAFFEGGRITVGGIHYVADGQVYVPVNETEFACDTTFGFRNADLRLWVEEKTGGRIRALEVASLAVQLLRQDRGAEAVRDALLALPRGSVIVSDAVVYADLETLVEGVLLAEATGKRYLARTAAGFVRVRAGMEAKPLLTVDEIVEKSPLGGLAVVGSYVAKSTRQLEEAMALPNVVPIVVELGAFASLESREAEIRRVAASASKAIYERRHALVYTSRQLQTSLGSAGDLNVAKMVSSAVVDIVRMIDVRPKFLIAKGGITSSDIATQALGIRRATVLGQAAPGVPVWKTGPECRFPGLAYVIFPGNVGGPCALKDMLCSW